LRKFIWFCINRTKNFSGAWKGLSVRGKIFFRKKSPNFSVESKAMHTGNIDPDAFIVQFAAQFEGLPAHEVKLETEFRQLPDWSSMQSLIVIASFDWEYGVTVSADELKGARTVGDLLAIVQSKRNA
jgi:acyl carrier protein